MAGWRVWYFGDGETCAPTFGRGFFFLGAPTKTGTPLRVGVVFVEVPHGDVLLNVARCVGEFFAVSQDTLEIIALPHLHRSIASRISREFCYRSLIVAHDRGNRSWYGLAKCLEAPLIS